MTDWMLSAFQAITLLATRRGGGVPGFAIEVKRSDAPTVERGFHTACDDLGITTRWLIYLGERRYPKSYGIEALPLTDALSDLMSRLN